MAEGSQRRIVKAYISLGEQNWKDLGFGIVTVQYRGDNVMLEVRSYDDGMRGTGPRRVLCVFVCVHVCLGGKRM